LIWLKPHQSVRWSRRSETLIIFGYSACVRFLVLQSS
jgi:hypothetical protein